MKRWIVPVTSISMILGLLMAMQFKSQVSARQLSPSRRVEDLVFMLKATEKSNKLLAEPDTLKIIGGQIHGGEGVKERSDFLAFAAKRGATLEDLAWMENIYSPPIGALFESLPPTVRELAVSPGVSVAEAWTSILALTLIYAVLMVVEVGLMLHFIRKGADPFEEPPSPTLGEHSDEPLTFAY